MPFRSKAQRRALWANAPGVARSWTKRYGSKIRPKRKNAKGKDKR